MAPKHTDTETLEFFLKRSGLSKEDQQALLDEYNEGEVQPEVIEDEDAIQRLARLSKEYLDSDDIVVV